MRKISFVVACLLFFCEARSQAWQPVAGTLTTRWAADVSATNAHAEYPTPQHVRTQWKNLNGLWDYAIRPVFEEPAAWDGRILVPYPVESALSGVKKKPGAAGVLWYHHTFTIPESWKQQHVILHFEAVNWESKVWVNGKELGTHRGGYDAFSFDITGALRRDGAQQITISAWNPADAGYQPNGKQYNDPRGIWYTASSGIWQTVWLEAEPENPLPDFVLTPDIHSEDLQVRFPHHAGYEAYTVELSAYDHEKKAGTVSGPLNGTLNLHIPHARRWSPSDPFLYDLILVLKKDGKKADEVKSYFGMRNVSLQKDASGIMRLALNDAPLFQIGPLDQGFWPDGLYTAPTDEALKFDIATEKDMGFNVIRKHVKVEPQRWYYWCDKLGMLVWQDMPSGDRHIEPKDPDIRRTAQSEQQYRYELKEMIAQHINHPSIVTWVTFNEGWGQFRTAEIAQFAKSLDPSRWVDATSGWSDRKTSDMVDDHSYPGPDMFPTEPGRASVEGEFGGQALQVNGHLWVNDLSRAPNHYLTSATQSALQEKYRTLIDSVLVLKRKGLSAAIYTQTTDVESELNGLMTYDRAVIKMDKAWLKEINSRLYK